MPDTRLLHKEEKFEYRPNGHPDAPVFQEVSSLTNSSVADFQQQQPSPPRLRFAEFLEENSEFAISPEDFELTINSMMFFEDWAM